MQPLLLNLQKYQKTFSYYQTFTLKIRYLLNNELVMGFFPLYNIQKCFNYFFTCFILQQIFVLLLEFSEKTCIIFLYKDLVLYNTYNATILYRD